jgi:hypothetical protein
MKAPKIFFAGLLALATAGANAQTVVHITGSTAFRAAVHEAITNILQTGFTYAYSGTSFTGASQAIFEGKAYTNGIQVIIKTSWSGSLAGIETVSQAVADATVNTFLTNTTQMSTAGTPSAPAVYDPPLIPEVCMSDGFQYTSQYPTPVLQAQSVGVVTFKFLKSAGAPTDITNMTPLLAQALWENGSLPQSMFSSNPDDTNIIYAIGRDPDSGTRKTAFLETGVQSFVAELTPAIVLQYAPSNSTGLVNKANQGSVTTQGPWPAETVDNIQFENGDAGYSSGGDLAYAMRATSGTPFIYVTYLGLSDAATAEAGGATELTYNGIPYSDQAVRNGQYTYWTYEQMDYLPTYGTTDANGKAVADSIAQNILTNTAANVGELLSTMNVTRTQEGGPVTPQ